MRKVKSTKMVLPATELPSTVTPFRVLSPEDDDSLLVVGRSRRGGEGGGAGTSQKHNQSHPGKTKDEQQHQHHHYNHQNKRSRRSCSVELEQVPVLQVSSSSGSSFSSQEGFRGRISGTETLHEERTQRKENASRPRERSTGGGGGGRRGSNSSSSGKSRANFEETNNKILNLLNARNSTLFSSTTSSKISEDELFSDLKSKFIEKHLHTILRSHSNSFKENNPTNGSSRDRERVSVPGSVVTLDAGNNSNNNNNRHLVRGVVGSNIGTSDVKNNRIDQNTIPKSKDGLDTLLKPIKIITVERPEPQLDLPRYSYFKSTKEKFLKMHDHAKIRVVERYRKLCASFRTTVWPKLHPLQVFVEVILSNLFVLCVAPFMLIAVILLCFVRFCIGLALKMRYKGRYQLMSGSDAAWADQSYANDSSFLSLYVIQGDCSISKIRDRIMKSVINCQDPQYPGKLTYSRLRCRIIEKFGFYCWEALHPMDFCIDDHVRYITNDPSAVLTQEQVLREIQKFIDQPLPADQPQWQILVVPKFLYSKEHDYYAQEENLEDDGFGNFDTITVKKKPNNKLYTGNHYYALVWRISHALMDGISAANCLQHCIADMPVKLTIDPLQGLQMSFGAKILMHIRMLIFGSRSLLRSMLYRDLNCFHGPGLAGPKTLAWSRGINLNALKGIRRKNDGTSTTALITSAVGGSLRELALKKNNPVPTHIRAGVTCALLPYGSIKPQNRFTVAHVKLKLELEGFKERLLHATKSAQEVVRNADVIKNYGLIRLVGLTPKKVIPWFMDNLEATVLVSNIPGPKEEYTIFQGQKLVDIIGWNTIKGNTAIGVCVFSYAGRVRAGVIADGAVLPSSSDVPSLIEEFEKEIVNLAKDANLQHKDVFMEAL